MNFCKHIAMTGLNLVALVGFFVILSLDGVSAQVVQHEMTAVSNIWQKATATWYGDPLGDGSTGGACGYGPMVDSPLLKTRVGAVSPVLYKNGEGCGECYKVRCLDSGICSRRAVTVIVTDSCPNGGVCAGNALHFDLSGAAYTRMAITGEGGDLRNRGIIGIQFKRTPCTYRRQNVEFVMNEGATPYWLSFHVLFENGDGDINRLEIKPKGSAQWLTMSHVWGVNYCLSGRLLHGPFSVRITTLSTNSTLTAKDVIPADWVPKRSYSAPFNFQVRKIRP